MDGKPIHDPSDLQHGQLYVAVPHASSFIQLDYLDLFTNLLPSIKLKAAKPKRSKRKQARSEEDIESSKTEVQENSQEEGEVGEVDEDYKQPDGEEDARAEKEAPADINEKRSKEGGEIANETNKQASMSQEHSEEKCELKEMNGKIGKSDEKKSKSVSKEDASKHVEVQVGEYPEEHHSGHALLHAKCVGSKCIDQECKVFRKEYPSRSASFLNMDESHHLEAVTVKQIMSEVIAVRNFLDSIVDHTMEQVKRRGVATQSYTDAQSLPILEEEEDFYLTWPADGHTAKSRDESVTTMELEEQQKELTTFADIARNRELEEEVHPLFAFDMAAFPEQQIPESAKLNMSHRKGVSFMQVDSQEPGLARDTHIIEKEFSGSKELPVGPRRSMSNVFVQQAAERLLATEESGNEREGQMATTVQPMPPFEIDKSRSPRMSILRSRNNSPLRVAQELERHLPVVVQSSFMSVRSSFLDPQSDQMKQNLSRLLEEGVNVVSDDEFDVIHEEADEEDSLSGDPMLSKGVQKDWKLNEEIYERAVQTGIVKALDDIVEAASQTSDPPEK